MKLSELSEIHLAAVVAGATFLGGLVSSLLGVFLVDAGTERQTDVQLVQLAVGILSEPLPEGVSPASFGPAETPETALREWAVDTINAAAEVKFDTTARTLLISGEAGFTHGEAMMKIIGNPSAEVASELAEQARKIERLLNEMQSQDEGAQP